MIVKLKLYEKWNLNIILQDTFAYFQRKPLFNQTILEFLLTAIKKEFDNTKYILTDKYLSLEVQDLKDLQYFKENFPKIYTEIGQVQGYNLKESVNNLKFRINLQMDLNPNNKELLSLYLADLFTNQLQDKKLVSLDEIRIWTSISLNNIQKRISNFEFDVDSVIVEISRNLNLLKITIIDDEILEFTKKTINNSDLLSSNLKIKNKNGIWKVNLTLDENYIRTENSKISALFSKEIYTTETEQKNQIKIQYECLPTLNKNDQLMFIAKILSLRFNTNEIISLSEFTNKISTIIKEIQENSSFFEIPSDLSEIITENNSQDVSFLTQIHQRIQNFNAFVIIYDWILDSIKQELFPLPLIESKIISDVRISEKNIPNMEFTFSFTMGLNILKQQLILGNSSKDVFNKQVYETLINHTNSFEKEVRNDVYFKIIIKRLIIDDVSSSNQDSKKDSIDIIYDLFYIYKKSNLADSSLYILQEEFKEYLNNYGKIVPKQGNYFNPNLKDDEIYQGIINLCEKNGIETQETAIISNLNKKYNSQMQLSNLILSKKDSTQVLYVLNEIEFQPLLNQLKDQLFSANSIKINFAKKKWDFQIYFLPKIPSDKLNLEKFPGQYIFQFTILKIKQEFKSSSLFFYEFHEKLRKWLTDLHEKYSVFDLNSSWKIEKVIEIIEAYDTSKFADFGIKIEFADKNAKEMLIEMPFLQKNSWNNLNKIDMDIESKRIWYKFSKSNLYALKKMEDFVFISQIHEFPIKVDKSDYVFHLEFVPIDINGCVEFSYLRFYFQNHTTFDTDKFMEWNPDFVNFLQNDLKHFQFKVPDQELREKKIKELILKFNKKLKDISDK